MNNVAVASRGDSSTLIVQEQKNKEGKYEIVFIRVYDPKEKDPLGKIDMYKFFAMSDITQVAVIINIFQEFYEKYQKENPGKSIPDIRKISFDFK